jgi:biotin carboxyl carrier protein
VAPANKEEAGSAEGKSVKAQVPGSVVRVSVEIGDNVHAGDTLIVLEAMKMEIEVKASVAGTVSAVAVKAGDKVTSGQVMAYIN